MSKFYTYIIVSSLLLISSAFYCQNFKAHTHVGFNIGAPIGPAEPTDEGFIESGQSFGLGVNYSLSKALSITLDVKLSSKKGSYDAQADGDTVFALEIPNQPPALFPTTFSGRVMGQFNNTYLEFPTYLNIKWKRSNTIIGIYQSLLIGGAHTGTVDLVLGNNFSTINDRFDDSQYIANYDFGLILGGEFYLVKDVLALGLNGTYGLTSIFTEDYPNVSDHFANFYANAYLKLDLFNQKK